MSNKRKARMKQFFVWLMNLPTNITSKVPDGTVCDYCGSGKKIVNFEGTLCICHHCIKRVADSVLKTSNAKFTSGVHTAPKTELIT